MLTIAYSMADQNFSAGKSLGIYNVSMNLVHDLAVRPEVTGLTVFANSTLENDLHFSPAVVVERHDEAIAGRVRRILWDQWGACCAGKRSGREWLFLSKGFASFVRPCRMKLAAIVYDAMTDYYARHYPRAVSRMEMEYFQRSMRATLLQARVIFTISEFTTSEVRRIAGEMKIRCPPVFTMGIGFDPGAWRLPGAGAREGLLVPASRWPHKKTQLAVEYLSRWQKERGFCEDIHWVGSLPAHLKMPSLPNWVVHSRLSNSDYRQRMAAVRAVLFFSEYEGFGMPPVEAALAGACPVFSDIPVTREVMADTGYPFLNERYESFRDAVNAAVNAKKETVEEWAGQLLLRHRRDEACSRVVSGLRSAR